MFFVYISGAPSECRREADGEENVFGSDTDECLQKLLSGVGSVDDEWVGVRADGYRAHPNQYLPAPLFTESESEEATPLKSYGFPSSARIRLEPDGSFVTDPEDAEVCDIDDSEYESWPDVTHTRV